MSFSNYKKFENVGIRSSNDTLIIMNSSNNNISLHSSDGGDDNVDTLSIKNIINKTPNMDLNLSSLNGTTINPVITINNNHGDCRIKTNLNVEGNLNINKIAINGSLGNSGDVLKSTGQGLEWGTGVDLSSSTGIGTKLISGDQLILGNSPISMNLNFSGINLHINGNIPTTAGQVLKTNANNDGFEWGAGLADVSGETDFGSKATKMVTVGNNNVGLNLNFSGNNLHINGNAPKAGQILTSTGSEVKWADTDYSLVSNQVIKIVTETASGDIFKSTQNILDLSSTKNFHDTYTAHDGYTINEETKKIIIIFNFAVFDSNLVSKIKLEVLINDVSKKSVIFKNMTGNQINDFVKYFTLTSTEYGTGSKTIKFKFTDMDNTGTIKIFTEDGSSVKQPTITLQEIGDRTVKAIVDETRGSKSDQIAKILVNTNATATKQTLNTSQATNYVYPYELHGDYTPSVSDTGTIIIIVNFATYISFNNNLTSKLKLELLLNNGSDTTIPQERKIILQEMNSNRSYEYTKYFSISKTAFGTSKKIELRFTDMNNSGNITLFTNDNSNNKQPTVTIQEIGSTTGWGSAINDIPIGQTTSADGSFNKVIVKHNLDVSGNINLTNGGMVKTTGIGSFGSINCGVGTFTSIDSGSGMIKTTGIGSFGSITTGSITATGNSSFNSITTGSIDSGNSSITTLGTINANEGTFNLIQTANSITTSGGITNLGGEILVSGGNLQLNDNRNLSFGTDDDTIIKNDGSNFLIQNTTSGGNITIDNQDADKKIIMKLGTNTTATSFEVQNSSGVAQLYVNGNGEVGIGNTNPSYMLDVSGDVKASSFIGNISGGYVTSAVNNATHAVNAETLGGYEPSSTETSARSIVERDSSGDFSAGIISARRLYTSEDIYLNGGDNLQIILDKVEKNGGEIIVPKSLHADESGYYGLFLDSEGNKIGLHSPN